MDEPREITELFRLEKVLKSSLSGVVFRATDPQTGTKVAIKLINRGSAADQEACRRRFLAAARRLKELAPPAFPAVLDCGITPDGTAFLVMEHVQVAGGLEALGGAPPARVLPLLAEVAASFAVLARAGVVHHNLSPENVLLTSGTSAETLRVVGFGSAAFRPEGLELSHQAGSASLAFAAPELVGGPNDAGADWRADLYSFSLVACQILGAQVVVGAGGEQSVAFAADLSAAMDDPELLRATLEKCLQIDPAVRPTSFEVVQHALAAGLARPASAASISDETRAIPLPRETITLPPALSEPPPAFGPPPPPETGNSPDDAAFATQSVSQERVAQTVAMSARELRASPAVPPAPAGVGASGDQGVSGQAGAGAGSIGAAQETVMVPIGAPPEPGKPGAPVSPPDEKRTMRLEVAEIVADAAASGPGATPPPPEARDAAGTSPTGGRPSTADIPIPSETIAIPQLLPPPPTLPPAVEPAAIGALGPQSAAGGGVPIASETVAVPVLPPTPAIPVSAPLPSPPSGTETPAGTSHPDVAVPTATPPRPPVSRPVEDVALPPVVAPPPVAAAPAPTAATPAARRAPAPARQGGRPWLLVVIVVIALGLLAAVAGIVVVMRRGAPRAVAAMPTPFPTARPAATAGPTPVPRAVRQLMDAEQALTANDVRAARAAVDAITAADENLLTAAEAERLAAVRASLGEQQRARLAANIRRGLTTGNVELLRRTVASLSPADVSELTSSRQGEAQLKTARQAIELNATVQKSFQDRRYLDAVTEATALLAIVPKASQAQDVRERSATVLEAEADAAVKTGDFAGGIKQYENLLAAWPDRSGLQARLERAQAEQKADAEMSATLAEINAAGEAKHPEKGLELLRGAQPTARWAAKFEQAKERLERQLAELDKQPPVVQLKPGYKLEFEKNKPANILVRVTDDHGVKAVTAMGRREDTAQYSPLAVKPLGNGEYGVEVPASFHNNDTVEFYVVASDLSGHTTSLGTKDAPLKLKKKRWLF
ncbi:MAG: protein kinase domain-containing protein [Acidobacteriota bacterium]